VKYAFITEDEMGWRLEIGQDAPGLASHGAAMTVGFFHTAEEAKTAAVERGVPVERIS
jgi:hypothetical protein